MLSRLTLDRTIALIVALLLAAFAIRAPVDTDTWWHLRSADVTLTQGMIHVDPFSHTFAGERWINHSWGTQIFFHAAHQALDDAGLALVQAALAIGGMMILYAVSSGPPLLRAFIVVVGASAAAVFWSARPQMFTFFLSCVVLAILIEAKRGRDRLWVLPLVMGVWGNLHAGFFIGFLLMGGALVGEAANRVLGLPALAWPKIGRLALMIGLSGLALLVNPYGAAMLAVPFQTVGMDALRQYIQEWNSPDFQGRETWPFIALIVLLWAAAWLSRAPFDVTWWALASGSLFLALLYGRNIAFFATVATPLIAELGAAAWQARGWAARPRLLSPRFARLNAILLLIVGLGVGLYAVGVLLPTTIEQAQARFLPWQAIEYLNTARPDGPLFNSYNWGGAIIFAAPDYPVFIDGRTDLYGDFLHTYINTAQAQGDWRGTLDTYGIRVVLIEVGSGLDAALQRESGWTRAYADELAVVYTR